MKKAMKKLLVLACAGVMALSAGALAACGGGETSTSAKPAGKTHDAVTLQVIGKDTYEAHNFVNGKCKMCDTTTIFSQDPIGGTDVITKACDQQGKVEKLEYTYHHTDGTEYTKVAYVYTPYGYNAEDKNTKYDVLYMLHGKGLDEAYWFAQGDSNFGPTYTSDMGIYTKGYGTENVLDNLMKEGKAKKTICVTMTYYLNKAQDKESDLGLELTKDLMPLIAEKYNTYAADGSEASLKANRDHQGYVGLSLGSMYSYQYILTDYVDYFSYIGSFSGSTFGGWDKIIENLNGKFAKTPIKYWYVGVGTAEDNTTYPGDPFGSYRQIVAGVDSLKPNENCQFVYCNKTAHNYATWITCLYNCMQVFFK